MFQHTAVAIKNCENGKVPFTRGAGVPAPDKCPNPVSMFCPVCQLHFCAAHGGNHGHIVEPPQPPAPAVAKPEPPQEPTDDSDTIPPPPAIQPDL